MRGLPRVPGNDEGVSVCCGGGDGDGRAGAGCVNVTSPGLSITRLRVVLALMSVNTSMWIKPAVMTPLIEMMTSEASRHPAVSATPPGRYSVNG